jgi:pimeloyl-ACP methyl ester carboxylesterase
MAEVQSAHRTLRPPRQSGYADVNGVHMYYEVYGGGSPLVLLHGGMLTIELNLARLILTLASKHQVIGVELQGHGRTADIDRAITPAALANDVAGLLDHLGIDRAHLFGHSMGGAARHPAHAGDPARRPAATDAGPLPGLTEVGDARPRRAGQRWGRRTTGLAMDQDVIADLREEELDGIGLP